jgi:hypothetical protein
LITPQWIDLEGLVEELRNSTINLHPPNKNQVGKASRVVVIAHVVGWAKPNPTTEQVLQLGNPTPNVTSMWVPHFKGDLSLFSLSTL